MDIEADLIQEGKAGFAFAGMNDTLIVLTRCHAERADTDGDD